MAEKEVNPQEEIANPLGMKVFVVCAESAVCLGSATVVGTGRDSVRQVYVLLS